MAMQYGALGAAFHLVRLFQFCSLIAIIGIEGKFIAVILGEKDTPSDVHIGVISVACIAAMCCIVSEILYFDKILPFLASAALDFLILIGWIVIAVVMGKPLSFLACSALSNLSDAEATVYTFTSHLESYVDSATGTVNYSSWISASKTICFETKAVWGLAIALCILYLFSSISAALLWRQKKAADSSDEGK